MMRRGADPGEIAAARQWLRAVDRDDVRAALEGVYARIGEEIARRGPVCWASGRCCNFEKTGHRLYVTGLEAAYCVRGLRRGEAQVEAPTMEMIDQAMSAGGCPLQVGNLCGAHGVKPLGCRVYFCDRSARAWQEDLSESALREVRAIHEAEGIEYRYGEWRGMLGLVVGV
jgi:Fe-S-cluster containining protein